MSEQPTPGRGTQNESGPAGFVLPFLLFGQTAVGLQAARGYNMDPDATCHDPGLVPPHGYLAFYAWIRECFRADAVVHLGKHGTLEWLPGKSLALSNSCWPEAVFGPMPHLYPFIVNDPGEGTQAKRRSQAVIIDHLTPPLARAESYGDLARIETMLDEYYDAAQFASERTKTLKTEILDLAARSGLDQDSGADQETESDARLVCLENYICSLKALQIRNGLHCFGRMPEGRAYHELAASLLRAKRGNRAEDLALPQALAEDFGLVDQGRDMYDGTVLPAALWTGPRPAILQSVSSDIWRTHSDTLSRLETLAEQLLAGAVFLPRNCPASRLVLDSFRKEIQPRLDASAGNEIDSLLAALAGRFVAAGPSGAPTRGRVDILPTGRNFWSVDVRSLPSPAAAALGWHSATLLLERHMQDAGQWPKRVALSAWGTASMRTGGDDIAQMLAFLGVRPTHDPSSARLDGFEIVPLSVLGRPRVDVVLRISGFFRDSFRNLVEFVSSVVDTVSSLDESAEENPLVQARRLQGGAPLKRIFGPSPGHYGAGLNILMDENRWQERQDFAETFLSWSAYAYGQDADGALALESFGRALDAVEAVIHNQDNREHDLLDSDDYYQFEGGLASAVAHRSGREPAIYHNDHSNPAQPKISSLGEEIARIIRARAVNPKWLQATQRHGYKGAAEMAATVDYLFAFAATTRSVRDHHFEALFDAYIRDEAVCGFLEEHNPEALEDMLGRFSEALHRRLWTTGQNDIRPILAHKTARLQGTCGRNRQASATGE